MAYKDLGNNIQFDPETGQIKIVDKSGVSQYEYDPRHGDKGGTLLGNQWFSGELNPNVIANITPEEFDTASKKYQDVGSIGVDITDPRITNAFGNTLGDYSQEQQNYQNQWSQLAYMKSMQDAYNTQAGQMGDLGDPFSTAIKNLAQQQGIMTEQQTKNAGIQAIIDQNQVTADQYLANHPGISADTAAVMTNPNLSDEVKQSILGSNYVKSQASSITNPFSGNGNRIASWQNPYVNTGSLQSTPMQPVQTAATQPVIQPQQIQPTPSDTSAAEPAKQPDYTGFLNALYSQVQPYITSLTTTQPSSSDSAFSSPTFNIGGSSTPRSNTISTNNASPDFNLGGMNPQSNYQTGSSSGKGQTSQPTSNQGMATGQFGSK